MTGIREVGAATPSHIPCIAPAPGRYGIASPGIEGDHRWIVETRDFTVARTTTTTTTGYRCTRCGELVVERRPYRPTDERTTGYEVPETILPRPHRARIVVSV